MHKFCFGFLVGVAFLGGIAEIASSASGQLCEKQGWQGAACQCRITMGLDKGKAS